MNLLLRLSWFAITCGYKPAIGLHQRVTKHFRVLPTDLDVNGHMTNSRYLGIMDLASLEILVRFGLLKRVPPALPEPVRLWLEAEEQLASRTARACVEATEPVPLVQGVRIAAKAIR